MRFGYSPGWFRQVSYRSFTDGGMDHFKRSNAAIQAVFH